MGTKNPLMKMSGLKFIKITVQKLAFDVPGNKQSLMVCLVAGPSRLQSERQDIETGTCDREFH
jgi:hypothetical protein